ncbi:MAG: excinuclease ABC subunit UvrC [Bacteroidota bacterium]
MSADTDKKKNHLIEKIVRLLPDKPGVYQFLDENETLIYVGKAKSLRKRVASYFRPEETLTGKVAVMVRKIADILTIIVETEYDALLLENNLIKKFLPRYNVLLKDDKTYPWICIKKERFPRIFPTRTVLRDGSAYFGPYASVRMMNTLLSLVSQLFPLRNCNYNLSTENVENKKHKVCLEFHIGNCKGPCEGLQTEQDYDTNIAAIRDIIKGNIASVMQQLKKTMGDYAADFEFEKAQLVKEKLDILEKYQGKSMVVNPQIHNVDVFTILDGDQTAYVNYLKVMGGSIVQAHTIEIKKRLDEAPAQLLALAVAELRERFESNSAEIYLSLEIETEIPGVKITVPQIGDKKKLIELSERNAKYYRLEKEKQKELVDPGHRTNRILEKVMKDLRLRELPTRIECFDNSNIQGDFAVAAMVVFSDAKPDKSEYRHFNIKTVTGANDYASMEEIVHRRYSRLLEEQKPLPQLIVIDGGKGQLSSAMLSLEKLGLAGKIAIIGIAKRLEEIYFPNDSVPVYLDKKSETLRLIQQLRDEAHRFGITHHRKKREKETIKSELTEISGIGEETAKALLRHFRSVENIRLATEDDIGTAIGKAKAKLVYTHFNAAQNL